MKRFLCLLLIIWSTSSLAGVVNFEIKFTPFVGNPATDDSVKTVAGKAQVFLNNVLISEQDLRAGNQPVLFEEREIGPEVWFPVASMGPLLRKGQNTARIEFVPSDGSTPYRAQMSWAEVNDQSTETESGGSFSTTNQSGEGKEIKEAQGKVVMEKTFSADFASDLPWHHAPAISSLSEEDKQQLLKMINDRAGLFKPKFEGLYQILEMPHPGIELDVAQIRQSGCLNKAYEAGIRVASRTANDVEFLLSGNQEVVVKGKPDMLYPFKQEDFVKLNSEDDQMCAAMALSIVYPSQMIVVKNTDGSWEIVF